MNSILIEASFPVRGAGDCVRRIRRFLKAENGENIYQAVELFNRKVFSNLSVHEIQPQSVGEKTPLNNICTLHNAEEIMRRPTNTEEMILKIANGEEVLMPDGLPNVKMVKTKKNELVLFDGHHTTLAYLLAGNQYLHEIPYLLILGSSSPSGVEDEKLLVFFGKHKEKIANQNWRKYTVSWTLPQDRQLQKRKQKNLGELAMALKEKVPNWPPVSPAN